MLPLLVWIISNESLGGNRKSNQGLIRFTILLQDSMFILIILKTRNPSRKLVLHWGCCDSENKNKMRNKPMNSIKIFRYLDISPLYHPCLPLDLWNKQSLDRESQNCHRTMEWLGLGGTLKPCHGPSSGPGAEEMRLRKGSAQRSHSRGFPDERMWI